MELVDSPALGTGGSRAARARVWALLQAIFGLGDLVDAGELSIDDALGAFATLLRAAFSPASGPRALGDRPVLLS